MSLLTRREFNSSIVEWIQRRNKEAVLISNGACNPEVITVPIHRHLKAMIEDGMGMDAIREDPAIRLMVHQLAFLMSVPELDE